MHIQRGVTAIPREVMERAMHNYISAFDIYYVRMDTILRTFISGHEFLTFGLL